MAQLKSALQSKESRTQGLVPKFAHFLYDIKLEGNAVSKERLDELSSVRKV